jgi:hypothetical protein
MLRLNLWPLKMMPFDLLDANITLQTTNANQNLLLF